MTPIESAGPGPGFGLRIRGVRLERRISTRELARRVGCSASLISQIERGATAPSASILYQLANELNTSLDYLFGMEVAPSLNELESKPTAALAGEEAAVSALEQLRVAQPGTAAIRRADGTSTSIPIHQALSRQTAESIVQRASDRRCIELAGGVRWERLTPTSDPYVDFLQVIYEPRGEHTDKSVPALRHDGHEYGLVLNGRLQANVGFDSYELGPGDSIAFASSWPHSYINLTDEHVNAVWFVVHREPWRA